MNIVFNPKNIKSRPIIMGAAVIPIYFIMLKTAITDPESFGGDNLVTLLYIVGETIPIPIP